MSTRPTPRPATTCIAVAVIAGAALLGACERAPDEAVDNRAEVKLPPAITKVVDAVPVPAPPLGRTELLAAIAQAASAHSAGRDDRAAQADLSGRRFALRLRFGCDGPAPTDSKAALRWSAAPGEETFKVSATPDLALDPATLAASDGDKVESVEGFWIARPWLLGDACPATAPDGEAVAPAPPEQTAGIAQYFTTADSRVRRRSGRAYETTAKLEPAGVLPRDGLVLLIEGRLRPWPGGMVIRCTGTGRAARPACIASAKIDRVAFERPASGDVLAEWTN